jgi:hypothetical protein
MSTASINEYGKGGTSNKHFSKNSNKFSERSRGERYSTVCQQLL